MMTSKFFGGVRGFAIAGNSMRTRIFLFLFFASTSGLWAQQARQVREVREERGEEARVQEANPAQGDIDRGAGTPVVRDNNGRIINRRIRVGEKKDNDKPIRGKSQGLRPEKVERGIPGNGTGGGGGGRGHGGIEAIRDDAFDPRPGPVFVRGDVNGDSQINMQDAIAIMHWWQTTAPLMPVQWGPSAWPWTSGFPCLDAADANDDGYLTPDDAYAIINYLWGNVTLPAPSPSSLNYITSDCGEDLTGANGLSQDQLDCVTESVVCE